MKRFKVGDLAKIIQANYYPQLIGAFCEIIEIDVISSIGNPCDYRINIIGFNCPATADGSFTARDKHLAPITDPDSSIPRQIESLRKVDDPLIKKMVEILEDK